MLSRLSVSVTHNRLTSQLFRNLFATLILMCSLHAAAEPVLMPVDQAATNPDFFSFRARLQEAVAKRDVAAVQAALSKNARLSFGDDDGLSGFKRLWKPSAPNSQLWGILASTLALGGTFSSDGSFTAPYVFSNWPEDKDAFDYMAAIGSDVKVYFAPNTTSAVVSTLNFNIVELAKSQLTNNKWRQIKLANNKTGFVEARFLRSAVGYRINFAKIDGRWQIVYFLAGD